jgi:hypothetical protein
MKQRVFPFTSLIELKSGQNIIFGGHIEFHKILFTQKISCPEIIVIPDTLIRDSLPQINFEFFLYAFLFLNGNFDFASGQPKKRLKIVGNRDRIEGAKDLLRLSFLGPTDSEFHTKWRINKDIRLMLRREMDYFALKNSSKQKLVINDFIELHPWDEDNQVHFDDVVITHFGVDKYKISQNKQTLYIDFTKMQGAQVPSWSPAYSENPEKISKFGIRILGASSGFDPANPSTSYLLYLNHERYLWDCAPFIENMLEATGVSIFQIKGIFVSHIHDDHVVDIIRFMRHGKFKVEIITTHEIQECLIKKISVLTGLNKAAIVARFKWRVVKPGVQSFINGYRFDWHYGVHSIPAIGVTISRENHALVISGDTAFKSIIEKMYNESIIDEKRRSTILELPEKGLAIMDAGDAIIHGKPEDYVDYDNTQNIVLAHCGTLNDEYKEQFRLAEPGFDHAFEPANFEAIDSGIIKAFLDNAGIIDSKWLVLFLEEKQDVLLARDEKITNKQSSLFIVANGIVDFYLNGEYIQSLYETEAFGFFTHIGIPWEARARCGSRIISINHELFSELLEEQSNFSNLNNIFGKLKGNYLQLLNSNFKFMDHEFSFETKNLKNQLFFRFLVSLIQAFVKSEGSKSSVKVLNAGKPFKSFGLRSNQIAIIKKGAISMRRPGLKSKGKRFFFSTNTIIEKADDQIFTAHCKNVIKKGEIKSIEPVELLLIDKEDLLEFTAAI